jgi:hypothetical protein
LIFFSFFIVHICFFRPFFIGLFLFFCPVVYFTISHIISFSLKSDNFFNFFRPFFLPIRFVLFFPVFFLDRTIFLVCWIGHFFFSWFFSSVFFSPGLLVFFRSVFWISHFFLPLFFSFFDRTLFFARFFRSVFFVWFF